LAIRHRIARCVESALMGVSSAESGLILPTETT
jgi:hypothetical protein